MTREALPWLADPWRRAAAALVDGRMPSGLLILGHAGLGRGRLARDIVAARLCPNRDAEGTPCGECRDCRQVAAGTHPDFLTVEPEEEGKALRVDQIRELARAMALTPGRQGVRCAVIAPAQRMTESAANGLLKTLEEPPGGTTLILVAEGAAGLPATIVSRCLRLHVPPPSREAGMAWLRDRVEPESADMFLALAGGAPLAAAKLAGDWPDDPAKTVGSLLHAAAGRAEPVSVANRFADWPLERLAELLAWLARGALRLRLGESGARYGWPRDLAPLAGRGDPRGLSGLWSEARKVALDPASLNPALARERLVLLFVNSFRTSARQGSRP